MRSDGDDVRGRGVLAMLQISALSKLLLEGLKRLSNKGVGIDNMGVGKDHWGRGREGGLGRNRGVGEWTVLGGAELVRLIVSGDERPERFSRRSTSMEGLITPLDGYELLGHGETAPEDRQAVV